MRMATLLLACLVGCVESSKLDDHCADDEDCSGDQSCVGPDEPQACGIPPQEICTSSADCGTGMACSAVPDACSPDGFGSDCVVPCDQGAGCGVGLDCVDGSCQPVVCSGNTDCATHEVCDPGSIDPSGPVHALTDGCIAPACEQDADCVGACVRGACQSGPGSCEVVEAVP